MGGGQAGKAGHLRAQLGCLFGLGIRRVAVVLFGKHRARGSATSAKTPEASALRFRGNKGSYLSASIWKASCLAQGQYVAPVLG